MIKALLILKKHLGFSKAVSLGLEVQKQVKAGEPFKDFDPPRDEREKQAREQAAPAFVLYKLLKAEFSQEKAYQITEEVVKDAAVSTLKKSLPSISPQWYKNLDNKKAELKKAIENSPNTKIGEMEINEDSFSFQVARCDFVEFAKKLNMPEVAPVFCSGDGLFFEKFTPEIKFERPQKLSDGGEYCDFRFQLKNDKI
ncbi:MAG: L-2-amino-thiazoline-4-carboxylic acid hydrolase [Patescibacteria group bacterium]